MLSRATTDERLLAKLDSRRKPFISLDDELVVESATDGAYVDPCLRVNDFEGLGCICVGCDAWR